MEDFISDGVRVAVIGRDNADLAELAQPSGAPLVLSADLLDAATVSKAFARIREEFGALDLAVNTVGTFSPPRTVAQLEPAELERTLRVNVVGVLVAMQFEIDLMRPGGGAVVNFSSIIGAHRTQPGFASYGASKAALSALTRSAALDHIGEGIRINAISPGSSDTTMSFRAGETVADRDARVAQVNPSGRVAQLSEIVAAVRYLCSDEASYVVGSDLVVDGGVSA